MVYFYDDLPKSVSNLTSNETFDQIVTFTYLNETLIPEEEFELKISFEMNATYKLLNYTQYFEITIFNCSDPNCIECLSYDTKNQRGVCSKCLDGLKLYD